MVDMVSTIIEFCGRTLRRVNTLLKRFDLEDIRQISGLIGAAHNPARETRSNWPNVQNDSQSHASPLLFFFAHI